MIDIQTSIHAGNSVYSQYGIYLMLSASADINSMFEANLKGKGKRWGEFTQEMEEIHRS